MLPALRPPSLQALPAAASHMRTAALTTCSLLQALCTANCCRFHQDGSIHVSVTMAGYCACTFWESPGNQTAFEAPFGTQVVKHVLCNLHDHMSGWKVDLDVGGTNNTFINTVGCWQSRGQQTRQGWPLLQRTPLSACELAQHSKLPLHTLLCSPCWGCH